MGSLFSSPSDGENDGRFPDESDVLVRYPAPGMTHETPRETWPWMAGVVDNQCGPDEWLVTVYAREVAMLEDGSLAPPGTPEEDMYHPQCFRDASELKRADAGTPVAGTGEDGNLKRDEEDDRG